MLHAKSLPARYFTPQEANELVPTIRAYLLKLREHAIALLELERRLDDAGHEERAPLETQKAERELGQSHLIDRIAELGAELIDPLEVGRVRFPAMRNGEPVWLIWNLGDAKVEKWTPMGSRVFGPQMGPESRAPRWEWRN